MTPWVDCPECGCPLLPAGAKKRPNEYDHAQGCPVPAVGTIEGGVNAALHCARRIRSLATESVPAQQERHGWELHRGQDVVVCPKCAFGMHADHSTPQSQDGSVRDRYVCPNCEQRTEHPPDTLTIPLVANDDALINCIFCRSERPCEFGLVVKREGDRSLLGIHEKCVAPLRAKNAPRTANPSPPCPFCGQPTPPGVEVLSASEFLAREMAAVTPPNAIEQRTQAYEASESATSDAKDDPQDVREKDGEVMAKTTNVMTPRGKEIQKRIQECRRHLSLAPNNPCAQAVEALAGAVEALLLAAPGEYLWVTQVENP